MVADLLFLRASTLETGGGKRPWTAFPVAVRKPAQNNGGVFIHVGLRHSEAGVNLETIPRPGRSLSHAFALDLQPRRALALRIHLPILAPATTEGLRRKPFAPQPGMDSCRSCYMEGFVESLELVKGTVSPPRIGSRPGECGSGCAPTIGSIPLGCYKSVDDGARERKKSVGGCSCWRRQSSSVRHCIQNSRRRDNP